MGINKKGQVIECIGYHLARWGEIPPNVMVADMTFTTSQFVGQVRKAIGIPQQKRGEIQVDTLHRIENACIALKAGIQTQDRDVMRLVRGMLVDVGAYKRDELNANVLDNIYIRETGIKGIRMSFLISNGYEYLLNNNVKDKWIQKQHLSLLLHYLCCFHIYTYAGKEKYGIKRKTTFADIVLWRNTERGSWQELIQELATTRKRMGLD